MQGRTLGHDERQARQVDARLDLAELAVRQGLGDVLRGDVAALDEDRMGHAVLPLDPFAQAFVAADEVLQRVLLQHAPHHHLAAGRALDLGLHGGRGVAAEIGQLGLIQMQLLDGYAGHRVVAGFLECPGRRLAALERRRRLHPGRRQLQRAKQ
ncbi:hypothetical protein D3C72_1621040 [compost metagenome]